MAEIFLKILNMSISASWIVLAVLLLRVLLKKAPKWINVILWGIVGLRLVMPFSFESIFSIMPSSETISPQIMMDKTPAINTGVPIINNALNPVISESFSPAPADSANPLQIWIPIISTIWVVGILAMLLYTVISYFRVKRKIGTAVLLRDNIFQSENVVSPFVLGFIKPKIYLPFNMSEQDMEHVIAHEQAHIKRKDYLWKPLGFLLLTIHWFNPVIWLGYVLLCRDIELACDEKVIKEFDNAQKADYSQALLTCSVNRRMIAACPLAFGEVGVKDRIKSVLNYKKPTFWIIVVAIITCIALAVGFLTNPITAGKPTSNDKGDQDTEIIKFKLVDEEHLGDYQVSYQYYDTKATSQSWKIVVEATRDVTNFRFIEIDESEKLKVGDTLFELETLKANSPILLHTYINDAVLNRGISYQDDNGVVRYFGFDYHLKDGSVSLSKIYFEELYNKFDVNGEGNETTRNCEVFFSASNTAFPRLKIIVTLDTQMQTATAVTVLDESTNKKIQNIKLGENEIFTNEVAYLVDINFDGEDDLIIPKSRPASAVYFSAYVWDTQTKQFVYAKTFETLSNVALDKDKKVILSGRSADKITSYSISVFDRDIKDFRIKKSLYYYPDGEKMVYEEECLKNGKMETVAQFTKPIKNSDYYSMDSEIYSYYSNDNEWKLNSSKWENYLIPQNETVFNGYNQNYRLIYEQFIAGEITAFDKDNIEKFADEYILNEKLDDYQYTFFDMTGDGIYELCIKQWPEMYFFTIKNGEVYHWYTETKSYSNLLNNGAFLFERRGGGTPHINYEYYELDENASVKFLIEFSWWDKTTLAEKEYPEFYEIGGQEVSKTEYQEKTKKYLTIGTDKIVWYDKDGKIKQ